MSNDWRKAIKRGETSMAERRSWLQCLGEVTAILEEATSLEEARRGIAELLDEAAPQEVVQ